MSVCGERGKKGRGIHTVQEEGHDVLEVAVGCEHERRLALERRRIHLLHPKRAVNQEKRGSSTEKGAVKMPHE